MTDRELLELAAKAAGIENFGFNGNGSLCTDPVDYIPWNPLTDDGDALRLAVKLEMLVHVETCYYATACNDDVSMTEHIGNDGRGCIYAATRRAIVRAAAEIGRAMP